MMQLSSCCTPRDVESLNLGGHRYLIGAKHSDRNYLVASLSRVGMLNGLSNYVYRSQRRVGLPYASFLLSVKKHPLERLFYKTGSVLHRCISQVPVMHAQSFIIRVILWHT
jgi:hypothetical protein